MISDHRLILCTALTLPFDDKKQLINHIETFLNDHNLNETYTFIVTGCSESCNQSPLLIDEKNDRIYGLVSTANIKQTLNDGLLNNKAVPNIIDNVARIEKIHKMTSIQFHLKQRRIALRNCGKINPLNINEYIANDGYLALNHVLSTMTQEDVIEQVIDSGLRGRGGGGFLTGLKWNFAFKNKASQKYIICNADEGDPGAFMDRAILEGDPHSVLEAMAIAGYAIGSNQGYVYVRSEYPVAVERLNHAIDQARQLGLLGKNILESNFDFDIELRLGAGAFVCGEETALIRSIEGYRGMPVLRPPFPAEKGLWGKPSNVNNVETLANIPVILYKGSDFFKSIGTSENSTGTKVFALGGKINNTGLIEVPMGTSLRDVIYNLGGGIPNNRAFKALQTGGPSGGCIVETDLDKPIDFDTLKSLGSMMGSGGMIIMDEDNCMVDVARFYLDFTVDESCGKCTPCREGTKEMKRILDNICEGLGTLDDINRLEKLGKTIQKTSLCGLGQTAPNPVLSTLKHFRDEYISHVVDHRCPAGVCPELTDFVIDDTCIGCTKCARYCPVDAISGDIKKQHTIDLDICIRCGACKKACPVSAISSGKKYKEVSV